MKLRSSRIAMTFVAVAAALVGALCATSIVRGETADDHGSAHVSRQAHAHVVVAASKKLGTRAVRPGPHSSTAAAIAFALCAVATAGIVSSRRVRAIHSAVVHAAFGRAPPPYLI